MVDWKKVRPMATQVGDDLSASLERMIWDGTVATGERLPSERALAADLGVSRTSLRDALRELELKGLVDRRPGRGTIVLDPTRAETEITLLSKIDGAQRDLQQIMDLRAVIEPGITARAARRATPADIRELHGITTEMEHSGVKRAPDLDVAFHTRIARSTHNPLLMRLIELASDWLEQTRREYGFSEERLRRSIESHRAIANAIEAREPDEAAACMARHLESVNKLFLEDFR